MADRDIVISHIDSGDLLPAGTYVIDAPIVQTVSGKTLNMHPDAVLLMPVAGGYSGRCIISVNCAEFTINGGELRGIWDMADQGTDAIARDPLLQNLIRCVHANSRFFTARRTKFTRCGWQAIYFDVINEAEELTGITLEDCRLYENFFHLSSIGYGAFVDSPHRVRLTNTYFGVTAQPEEQDTSIIDPETGTPVAWRGGNQVGSVNLLIDFRAVNCVFEDSGRMSIELWRSEAHPLGLNGKCEIINCTISRPHYRTVSTVGTNTRIRNCVMTAKNGCRSEWLELVDCAYNEVSNCELNGVGVFWNPFYGEQVIRGNTFRDIPGRWADDLMGAVFNNIWNTGEPEYLTGFKEPFSIIVEDNTFEWAHSTGPTYPINRFADPENRVLAVGGNYKDSGNNYTNTTLRPNYLVDSTTIAQVLPLPTPTHKVVTALNGPASADVSFEYDELGDYTVTLADGINGPVNISWRENEAGSSEDKRYSGEPKNFYFNGGSRVSDPFTPVFPNHSIDRVKFDQVMLK